MDDHNILLQLLCAHTDYPGHIGSFASDFDTKPRGKIDVIVHRFHYTQWDRCINRDNCSFLRSDPKIISGIVSNKYSAFFV